MPMPIAYGEFNSWDIKYKPVKPIIDQVKEKVGSSQGYYWDCTIWSTNLNHILV